MARAVPHLLRSLATALGEEHRRVEALLYDGTAAVDSAPPLLAFELLARRLRAHIDVGDRCLFPAFERQTGMRDEGPTVALRHEHREIERRLQAMEDGPDDAARTAAELGRLRALLDDHFQREESVLYPACDRLLEPQERVAVLRGLAKKEA